MRQFAYILICSVCFSSNAGPTKNVLADYLKSFYSESEAKNPALQKLRLICLHTANCTSVAPDVCFEQNVSSFTACADKVTSNSCSISPIGDCWESVKHCFSQQGNIQQCMVK